MVSEGRSRMETLVLASRSPRRQELLSRVGIPFEAEATEADESCSLPAREAVAELSRRKAEASRALHPGRYILAADTLVTLDGAVLGKPESAEEAVHMLETLCGRTHEVFTGVTIITPSGRVLTRTEGSRVTFCTPSRQELEAYVRSGEPMDKAGAYAIQGRAGLWITHIEGSDSNIIGLPLHLVREMLLEAGYAFF